MLTWAHNLLNDMDTRAILCRLVEPLNRVAYGHVLVERVKERSRKDVNMGRVFTQSLTLVLTRFIEAARTSLLNNDKNFQMK